MEPEEPDFFHRLSVSYYSQDRETVSANMTAPECFMSTLLWQLVLSNSSNLLESTTPE